VEDVPGEVAGEKNIWQGRCSVVVGVEGGHGDIDMVEPGYARPKASWTVARKQTGGCHPVGCAGGLELGGDGVVADVAGRLVLGREDRDLSNIHVIVL
jgi:hypothetical protein